MTIEARPLLPNLPVTDGLLDAEMRQAVDAAGTDHPEFAAIRGRNWADRAERAFDSRPPRLDERDSKPRTKEAWTWCRAAWTALLAPQLYSVGEWTSRESEPFTFGYLSGDPSALVELLGIKADSWLASSIVVGPHADVFGEDALFEAHQLCAAITEAGDLWPTATRTNNFEAGWKAGYVEMLDLLSGDPPAGLLGRFLRDGLEVADRPRTAERKKGRPDERGDRENELEKYEVQSL